MVLKSLLTFALYFCLVSAQNEHVPRYGPRNKPQKFTLEQLKQYDGSDPNIPIYLAVKGKVEII